MDEIVCFVLVAEGEQVKVRVSSGMSELKEYQPVGKYAKEIVNQMNLLMTDETRKQILAQMKQ
jgi:hypothetical protein